jgi:hypothetical protein
MLIKVCHHKSSLHGYLAPLVVILESLVSLILTYWGLRAWLAYWSYWDLRAWSLYCSLLHVCVHPGLWVLGKLRLTLESVQSCMR